MNYYLGVDIGTSSAKAVAFTLSGDMIERRSVVYGMQHPLPDRSEQDPDEITRAVRQCIYELVSALMPSLPSMVAFSAAMHSILAVDAKGVPLTPCIIWADNRAGDIAEVLRNSEKGRSFYRASGVPVHAMTPLCKLIWLRKEEPLLFQNTDRFMGIKEYVFLRLFGEHLVDSSIASATGLLNIHTLQWDENILQYLAVDHSKLGKVVPPGHVLLYDAMRGDPLLPLPLPPGTPVVIGGSDGAAANLATDATGDRVLAITIGTSGAARMVISGAETDEEMRTFCYHVKNGYYIRGGATNNGAVVIQWLRDALLQTEESYEELLALAATVPHGAEELLFIPYILGERAPIWNSKARGIYFGLDIRHTKAHLIRAAMEGVLYGLYSIAGILTATKNIEELHATGGFARSPLWLQMLADIFNSKVLAFGEEESSTKGAIVIGMEAIGQEPFFQRKILSVYEPDLSTHVLYQKKFEKFERIYKLVKDEFNL